MPVKYTIQIFWKILGQRHGARGRPHRAHALHRADRRQRREWRDAELPGEGAHAAEPVVGPRFLD